MYSMKILGLICNYIYTMITYLFNREYTKQKYDVPAISDIQRKIIADIRVKNYEAKHQKVIAKKILVRKSHKDHDKIIHDWIQ